MHPEQEYSQDSSQSIASSARSMLWSLVFDRIIPWEDTSFENLNKVRNDLGPLLRDSTRIATSEIINLSPGSNIVDWGAGSDAFFPWIGVEKPVNLTAIEPAEVRIRLGQTIGRIPKALKLVTRSRPPYGEIDHGSVDGVIAHSTFHLLPNPDMKAVLSDLVRYRLREGGVIGHIQDIGPLPDYLAKLDTDTKETMQEYLKLKYQVSSLSAGDLKENGGIWSIIYERMLSEISMLPMMVVENDEINGAIFEFKYPHEISLPQFPVIGDHEQYLKEVAKLTGTNLEGRLSEIARCTDSLEGLIMAEELFLRWLTSLADLHLVDIDFQHWIASMVQACLTFNQDVFESYLAAVFLDLGLETRADRVTTALPVPLESEPDFIADKRLFFTYIDGCVRTDILNPEQHWSLYSMRRIIGRKKI